jgi:5-methylcytosine-specific restriction endonuclease McrA
VPYYLTSDNADLDPRWMVLADGKAALADQLYASWHRMHGATSRHMHDGYLTHHDALTACRGRAALLRLLCSPTLGSPPLLHRQGETCSARNCLDDSGPWVDGFAYRICGFSKRNPNRAEKARNDAQKADSRDARLRELVYDRDGGCCRYCRSGPLRKKGMGRARDRRRALQFDHVDPDRAAGPDGRNYVTACARCNESKGQRTPDEAGMTLLPVPTDAQRAAWAARGEQLYDVDDQAAAEPVDNARDNPIDNAPDNQHDNAQAVVGGVVGGVVPLAAPEAVPAGEVRLQQGEQAQRQPAGSTSEGSGSGRVGQPLVPPVRPFAEQLARPADAPDIYHRRSRAPAEASWPPPPSGVP